MSNAMNKWMELMTGLVLVLAAIIVAFYSQTWGMWNFWTAAGEFFKGGVFWFVIMVGLLFILLGISDLREPAARPAPQHAPQPKAEMPSKKAKK